MAYLLPRSVFIHIPKTGGQWVVSALERAGVPLRPLGVVHTSPDEIASARDRRERPFMFAMVRHPLTWYQSMWAHQTDDGWEPIDAPDWFTPRWVRFWAEFTKRCASDRFPEFVERCLETYPDGLVSTLYESYTSECTFVGRREHLARDLAAALEGAGEVFDAGRLTETPARNVRGGRPHRFRASIYTPDLVDRVMEAERHAIERFDYRELPSGMLPSARS